jgi:CrcB protein
MNAGTLLLVGLAGGLGSLLRFLVDGSVTRRVALALPVGTIAVNLSGAVLLGFVAGLAASTTTTLIAGTGLVGGYTTFSTWMFETERLAGDGRGPWAIVNVAVSVVVGAVAIVVGRTVGGWL